MKTTHYLWTGQKLCHDEQGREVACAHSGQDAEHAPGEQWPEPRFEVQGGLVLDKATGLVWTRDANPFSFPLTWPEALGEVARMNRDAAHGFADWRLPNRREMRSLISHAARKPALPETHPFTNVFLGWRWTSTTSAMAPAYAWYVHLEGGRMFYGAKDSYCLAWPVRGDSLVLPATGQRVCFEVRGAEIPCTDSGQDGETRTGAVWPEPRFEKRATVVADRLTNLVWTLSADLAPGVVSWPEALGRVAALREETGQPWRLPTINELESLVDAAAHSPALPAGHPFRDTGEAYWSSTTSHFEPDWAYCLYLHKGAVGVGYKPGPEFLVWAVREED